MNARTRTPEYIAWTAMIYRCENPRRPEYPRYGGRGIRVAPEWRHDFNAFLSHIGPRPSSAHSVDRIDVNGGYAPGNVRWATAVEQAQNRRSNRTVTVNGETMCVSAAARSHGLKRETFRRRIGVGESPDAATRPARVASTYEYRGRRLTVEQISDESGVPRSSLRRRLGRHGDAESAIAAWHRNNIWKGRQIQCRRTA